MRRETKEKIAEAAALEVLKRELAHQLRMNVASGYVLDPSLPAPEVFERPGWKILHAPDGTPEIRVPILRDFPISFVGAEDAVPEFVEPEIVSIRPAVECFVELAELPGYGTFFGLGFNVETRTWVVFHLGTRRIEAAPAEA